MGGSGSAGAVLRGLIEEAEAEEQFRAATSSRQIADIRRSAAASAAAICSTSPAAQATGAASLLGRSSGRLFSLLDL